MKRLSSLLLIGAICAGLAACSSTSAPKHGQFDETEYFPDGSVKKKTTASSDYALYIAANKTAAPVAKVSLPAPGGGAYAVEIPMVAGQTQQIAAPAQETSFVDRVLDRGERWLGFALQGYGIHRNSQVAIEQSRNNRDERIATVGGFTSMGAQIRGTAGDGFTALGQVPRVSTINVSGNALLGDGNLNINSGNTTRTCSGGQAASGGSGGAGGGTGQAGAGAAGGAAPGGQC